MDTFNKWLTLATNLGVIAGLVVLIYEVNQNTLALQNEADIAVYNMAAEMGRLLIEDEYLRNLVVETSDKTWNDFEVADQILLSAYWGNEIDRAELQFRLFRRRGEPVDNIVLYEPDLLLLSFNGWWKASKYLYETEFVAYFDAVIDRAKK